MYIDFCFGYPFSEKDRRKSGLESARCLSGFYIYNTDQAFINIGSKEFGPKMGVPYIVTRATYIAIHETLHKAIYDITGNDANDTEEKFVEEMIR